MDAQQPRRVRNVATAIGEHTLDVLDAIHLATALLWKEMEQADIVMATHDTALALGAQACGLAVIGVPPI